MNPRAIKYLGIALLSLSFLVLMLPLFTRLNASYPHGFYPQQVDNMHASGPCADFPVGGDGISYQPISTEVDPDKQQIIFNLSLQFFSAAVLEKDYSALIFFDGRQVYHGDDVMRLRCGEEARQQFVVDISASGMPNTAHFFIIEVPDDATGDASSSHFAAVPHAAASEIIRFASAMPYHSDTFADIPVTIIPHPDDTHILMYLFDDDPEEQLETTVTLAKGRQDYDFSLRFQKEKHMADIISLTCTLDNQQQAVFHGHHFWSGTLNNGDEIHLRGKVSVNEAGWHALRCFILNGLYDDTAEFSTSFVPVVYIYKAE